MEALQLPARISPAASSLLARQIVHGAPASLFVSANREWMQYLDELQLLVPDSRRSYLQNSLVLVVPSASELQSLDLGPDLDWSQVLDGPLAMADPAHVPAGQYAKAALLDLQLWQSLQQEQRILAAVDVRAALALVAMGEVAMAVVYATDARSCKDVRVVAALPVDVRYEIALLRAADSPETRALLAQCLSKEAAAHFAALGFKPMFP